MKENYIAGPGPAPKTIEECLLGLETLFKAYRNDSEFNYQLSSSNSEFNQLKARLAELKGRTLYVVTEGEYSDYHIVCIFEDKEKADNYVKYHQDGWGGSNVEEYGLADNGYKLISTGYCKISGEVTIDKKGMIKHSQIHGRAYLIDNPETYSSLYDNSWRKESSDEWNLHLIRSFPESSIRYEEEPAEKLMHILKDTAGQIADLRNQGYDIDDVRKMLGFE